MKVHARNAGIRAVSEDVSKARESDSILSLELYCDESGCPAREIRLLVKDHDSTFVNLIKRQGGFRCPLCASPAKMHWVRTARQEAIEKEHSARCNVAMQMMRRDRTPDGGLFVMSASEVCDDRLPPTPDGWFKKPHQIAETTRRRFVRDGEE